MDYGFWLPAGRGTAEAEFAGGCLFVTLLGVADVRSIAEFREHAARLFAHDWSVMVLRYDKCLPLMTEREFVNELTRPELMDYARRPVAWVVSASCYRQFRGFGLKLNGKGLMRIAFIDPADARDWARAMAGPQRRATAIHSSDANC